MKKWFISLAAGLVVLAACQPETVLTIDKTAIQFDSSGGSVSVYVTSNYEWKASSSSDNFAISPDGGAESGYAVVTALPNTSSDNRSAQILFSCTGKDVTVSQTLAVTQVCMVGSATFSNWDGSDVPAGGKTFDAQLEANGSWTLSCDASDVTLSKTSGSFGRSTVTVEVPVTPDFEGRTIKFKVSCTTAAGTGEAEYQLKQLGGLLLYGGVVYNAAQMKDGQWWMTENLRYIPDGMTPSHNVAEASNGIWYPVVVSSFPAEGNPIMAFSTETKDIESNGYLYSTEVALGLKPGDVTVDNAGSFEGKQGVCPSGWHIPTKADIIGLLGKTSVAAETNENAPYYDAALKSGSVELLNADGFNAGAWGAISIGTAAMTKGTLFGAVKAYTEGMNTGYIAGSTLHQVTKNDDGTLKNVQYVGIMPNMRNGTYAGAFNNYRNGVSVRCVKNK